VSDWNDEFTRIHFPARWHYDVLRGLDALLDAGAAYDPRLDDALTLIRGRRRPDGRWTLNRHYTGETHRVEERAVTPSRWATLIASRVLEGLEPGQDARQPLL
jgi:hypothetical protein